MPDPIMPNHNIIKNAHQDDKLLQHKNLLKNLLKLEMYYITTYSQIFSRQTDIQPWMRKTVISWLLEVSNELKLEKETFEIAVNLLDRMLKQVNFKRDQFQLLAGACLLISGKLKETIPVMPEKIILYTDNSITFEALTNMENLILAKLNWDVSSPTHSSFIEILTPKILNFTHSNYSQQTKTLKLENIKITAMTIARKSMCETEFIGINTSILSAAAILVSILKHVSKEEIYFSNLKQVDSVLRKILFHYELNLEFSSILREYFFGKMKRQTFSNYPEQPKTSTPVNLPEDPVTPSPRRRKSLGGVGINIYPEPVTMADKPNKSPNHEVCSTTSSGVSTAASSYTDDSPEKNNLVDGESVNEMNSVFPNQLEKFGKVSNLISKRRHSMCPKVINRLNHKKRNSFGQIKEEPHPHHHPSLTSQLRSLHPLKKVPSRRSTLLPNQLSNRDHSKILQFFNKNFQLKLLFASLKSYFLDSNQMLDLTETYEKLIFKIICKFEELEIFKIEGYDYELENRMQNSNYPIDRRTGSNGNRLTKPKISETGLIRESSPSHPSRPNHPNNLKNRDSERKIRTPSPIQLPENVNENASPNIPIQKCCEKTPETYPEKIVEISPDNGVYNCGSFLDIDRMTLY